MMKTNVCAGIVLHNPEIGRLVKCYKSIKSQVDHVIVVDNNSENLIMIRTNLNDSNITWICNSKNVGMACALNRIFDTANRMNYNWVMTLDQDSIVSSNAVAVQFTAIQYYDNVAMVAPYMIDTNIQEVDHDYNITLPDYECINECITSGTLTNVQAILKVNGFCEYLFIDYVDYDICIRIRGQHYCIIRANKSVMLHKLGNTRRVFFLPKTIRHIFRIDSKVSIYVPDYPPKRVFYQTRNLTILLLTYKHRVFDSPLKYWISFVRGMCLRFIFESHRFRKLLMFICGTLVGILKCIRVLMILRRDNSKADRLV